MLFSSNNIERAITKEYILRRVSQADIFRFYLGIVPAKGLFCSPFREDKTPTCSFYVSKSGVLLIQDLATRAFYDCFKVVQLVYNLKYLSEALDRIYKDLEEINNMPTFILDIGTINSAGTGKYIPSSKTKLQIETRDFRDYDLTYWNQFGISERTLRKYNVHPVLRSYLNGNLLYAYENPLDPCYAYYFKETDSLKLYRPKNKKHKWLSNVSHNELQGCQHVKYTEDLYITKSLKDVMTLHEIGINAVAVQSETSLFPDTLIEIIANIKSSGYNVYILYDNDKPGIEAAMLKSDQYNLPLIFIPTESNTKDASDFAAEHGILALSKLFDEINRNYRV